MNLTTHDTEKILSGYLDEQRVILHCGTHNYAGPGSKTPPVEGCSKCAHVMLYTIIARKQGDKKAALDELSDLIHALVELAEEGTLDYQSLPRPEIHIEKVED